jgi:hypothetical protein
MMGDVAALLMSIADELEVFEYERQQEALTLPEASRESGYSVAHLSRMISEGKLESVATGRIPMVRRGDLPKKRPQSTDGPDLLGKVGRGYGESPK